VKRATARAHPNIAFIKYWGNRDDKLRLPANGSLSMNLDGLYAETTVEWDDSLSEDRFTLNAAEQSGEALNRVAAHLERLRQRFDMSEKASVVSANNFPTGAGIASSAAAFAALSLAGVAAAGISLSERELTTLARLGSGSASRSVPGGFVEWYAADTHEESYAETFADHEHWDLVDVVAVVSESHKAIGSSAGHQSAWTSELQTARVSGASERIALCKQAILERDFAAFAEVVERDSNLMHAVMMTSRPPLFYWEAASLTIMKQIPHWRAEGLQVCYTLDAGANVHCICVKNEALTVSERLKAMSDVRAVRMAGVGGTAVIVASENIKTLSSTV
jgi:diphosphomevalonate decarboxylase